MRIFFLIGLAAGMMAGCAPTVSTRVDARIPVPATLAIPPRGERAPTALSRAEGWLRAGRDQKEAALASGDFLSAARTAWEEMFSAEGARDRRFEDLYNAAVAGFFSRNGEALARGEPVMARGPEGVFRTTVRFMSPLAPGEFDRVLAAEAIRVRGFRERSLVEGVGAALVGTRDWTPERAGEFAGRPPGRGANQALSGLLVFHGKGDAVSVEAVLADPCRTETVEARGKTLPLAADFTAPLALAYSGGNDLLAGITGLFNARARMRSAGIYLAEPLDREKIPVLMIHGLGSSPFIWREMAAQAMMVPAIRRNYQFWFAYYPSGVPLPMSAALLREKIEALRKCCDPEGTGPVSRRLVVAGHSMGGVLARMLAKDAGDRLWNEVASAPFEKADLNPEMRERVKAAVFWRPTPGIERGIYFAAPHRGAKLADSSLGQLGVRLIRLPVDLLRAQAEMFDAIGDLIKGEFRYRRFTTSIQSLSPSSPLYPVLERSPDAPGYRFHSVIGDRGRGDTPQSSDGVVAYWSSHLEGAESELILPARHDNVFLGEAPEAEFRRILLLNLRERGPALR